jgi:hypothetical protein
MLCKVAILADIAAPVATGMRMATLAVILTPETSGASGL